MRNFTSHNVAGYVVHSALPNFLKSQTIPNKKQFQKTPLILKNRQNKTLLTSFVTPLHSRFARGTKHPFRDSDLAASSSKFCLRQNFSKLIVSRNKNQFSCPPRLEKDLLGIRY